MDTTADPGQSNAYFVRPVLNGGELSSSNTFALPAGSRYSNFSQFDTADLPVELRSKHPATPSARVQLYILSANDASVGDLDGDGQYEIILKWDPSNSRDNASAGLSGPVVIDAYKLDERELWRIDLGRMFGPALTIPSSWSMTLTVTAKRRWFVKTADGTRRRGRQCDR
jgi:rhamnogalacturonan endolyase